MPSFAHTVEVDAPSDQVFGILDDVSRTPEWLEPCTAIDKHGSGPNGVGTPLTYHYRRGRQSGTMSGEIIAYEVGRRIAMTYSDRLMSVTVDFITSQHDGGRTTLTHAIDVKPQGFGWLFTPFVRRRLPGQTVRAMTRLKELSESVE